MPSAVKNNNVNNIDILDVADFTILNMINMGISISPLKLQKMLYYIQAWHLVYFQKTPLFSDIPEAWVNGPVYDTVYRKFKSICLLYEDLASVNSYLKNTKKQIEKIKEKIHFSDNQIEFLSAIYYKYGCMSHDKLVLMTHMETPWRDARKGLNDFEYSENIISHESMYKYYKNILKSNI